MAFKVIFDAERCQGYANCLIEAPEIWEFDENSDKAVLLKEFPGDQLRAKAEASMRGCPAGAIRIEDVDA
ncbi:MAG: ferredoxin [Micromonosporaceae bacterium]